MIDIFASFIESFSLFFIIEIAVLLFLLFLSEGVEQGFIAFVSLIGFYCICLVRHETDYLPEISIVHIALYVLIGLMYALVRLYLSGVSGKIHYWTISNDDSDERKQKTIEENKKEILSFIKDNFFRWWGIWPISFLYYFFTDILVELKDVFLKFTGSILIKVYETGRGK